MVPPDDGPMMAGREEPGLYDITSEATSVPCLVLSGSIPPWLSGSLYRQSGAAFPHAHVGFAYVHGLAHVAALRFEDSCATMTNRAVRTEAHARWKESGVREWANPHEIKLGSSNEKVKPCTLYDGSNPNVTVWKVGDKVAALSEAPRGRILELDALSLDTLNAVDMMDDHTTFLQAWNTLMTY